jgi:hypothetical protein
MGGERCRLRLSLCVCVPARSTTSVTPSARWWLELAGSTRSTTMNDRQCHAQGSLDFAPHHWPPWPPNKSTPRFNAGLLFLAVLVICPIVTA